MIVTAGTRNGKSKTEPRTPPAGIGSIANPAVGINVGGFSPHIMSLAAWGPSLRGEEVSTKSRKRSHSPSGNDAIKHPRMVVLKQGDGPALGMNAFANEAADKIKKPL